MIKYDMDALEYISKLSDGGLRDAISLMDKCLSYNAELTLKNVVVALGTVDYDVMIKITDALLNKNSATVITELENLYQNGKDLKQFLKSYIKFIIDVNKFSLGCDWKYVTIPRIDVYEKWLTDNFTNNRNDLRPLLDLLVDLDVKIKYSFTPLYDMEAAFILL